VRAGLGDGDEPKAKLENKRRISMENILGETKKETKARFSCGE
jgi:hypothetical protein